MTHIVPIALEKTGTTKIFSRFTLFSSTKYYGLGLLSPWYHQKFKLLQILIGETVNKTSTENLFQATSERLRKE